MNHFRIINWKVSLVLLSLVSLVWISCEDDSQDFPIVVPSIKTFEATNDTADRFVINATASADNVNFYTFIFHENGKKHYRESEDGTATYIYTEPGDHLVSVRANATTEIFSELSKTISIASDTNSGPPTGIPTTGYTTPLTYPNYTLVWQDEFDGTELDQTDWTYEIGNNNGWGNNELQYYTEANTSVSGGYLTIEARAEFFNNYNYTSSRIKTQGKESFQYGRIDIRAAMPEGQGMWPALWMLGSDITSVGWPKCGEIDIMEMAGGLGSTNKGDDVVLGTAHWENGNGVKSDFGGTTRLTNGGKLSYEFHVYSIIWDSQKIEWYFDDQRFHVLDITPADMSEFHQKHFFIFNVAVGGTLPGNPDGTTVFPQRMYVDYVRVFQ